MENEVTNVGFTVDAGLIQRLKVVFITIEQPKLIRNIRV